MQTIMNLLNLNDYSWLALISIDFYFYLEIFHYLKLIWVDEADTLFIYLSYTLKKKGFLPNLKRFFTWIHGKILFWFRRKRGSVPNHISTTEKKGFVPGVPY